MVLCDGDGGTRRSEGSLQLCSKLSLSGRFRAFVMPPIMPETSHLKRCKLPCSTRNPPINMLRAIDLRCSRLAM
jgi:hypothetical protein